MREKLARAMQAIHLDDGHYRDPARFERAMKNWKRWLPFVDAILAAMSEPSEAMVRAGDECQGGIAPNRNVWQAMLKAAGEE